MQQNTAKRYLDPSFIALRNMLNKEKDDIAPWYGQNSKEVFATGCENASKAHSNWISSLKGTRKGHKMGYPKYKSRHHDTGTGIKFTTGAMRLEADNLHLNFPKLGKIKLHERMKAARWILSNGGRIANITVQKSGSRWFANISIRLRNELALKYFSSKIKINKNASIGVDVGLKTF